MVSKLLLLVGGYILALVPDFFNLRNGKKLTGWGIAILILSVFLVGLGCYLVIQEEKDIEDMQYEIGINDFKYTIEVDYKGYIIDSLLLKIAPQAFISTSSSIDKYYVDVNFESLQTVRRPFRQFRGIVPSKIITYRSNYIKAMKEELSKFHIEHLWDLNEKEVKIRIPDNIFNKNIKNLNTYFYGKLSLKGLEFEGNYKKSEYPSFGNFIVFKFKNISRKELLKR